LSNFEQFRVLAFRISSYFMVKIGANEALTLNVTWAKDTVSATMSWLGLLLLVGLVFAGEPPSDWAKKVARAGMLWGESEPEQRLMTSVANGYLATVVGSQDMYIQGVFNGAATKAPRLYSSQMLVFDHRLIYSHRARVPSFSNIAIDGLKPYASAIGLLHSSLRDSLIFSVIDMECNSFYRRSTLTTPQTSIPVEQIIFASASGLFAFYRPCIEFIFLMNC